MTTFTNTAAGGTDGATVTVTNSGGASGDPWTVVSKPSGTTLTFAASAAYEGSLGYRFTHGTGSGAGTWVRRSVAGDTQLRDRFYLECSAYPTVAVQVAYVSDSDGIVVARVILTTAGHLGIQNKAGTTLFTSGPIGLNTDVRVEWIVAPGTTSSNGTVKFGWAVGEAAISGANTFSSTSADVGTKPLKNVSYGKLAGTWNATVHVNHVSGDSLSSVDFLGPVTTAPAPAPPPPAPSSPGWPPDPYRQVIRGPADITYTVDAAFGGEPVAGASGMAPVGGTITDTTKPGVRRLLTLELAAAPGLYDLLAPIGTMLTVTATVTYTNRSTLDIPMGVFEVDTIRKDEAAGKITLTAPDKWARIQRARFVAPTGSMTSHPVSTNIAELIRGAWGAGELVTVTATSTAVMGGLVWERDRDKAILELAESIGAWVFFDRQGVATVADIPTIGSEADWLVDASASGVLTGLDRERSRAQTRNVVVVESSAADGEKFPTQRVWDDDPNSPTYAGTNPLTAPETAGPFGVVPMYYSSPLLASITAAREAGGTILARVTGLASQVSLGQVPNPAVDAFDVIDVLPPRERYDIARVLERHVVDTVTHPLVHGSAQQIEGRSTRLDEIVGGS